MANHQDTSLLRGKRGGMRERSFESWLRSCQITSFQKVGVTKDWFIYVGAVLQWGQKSGIFLKKSKRGKMDDWLVLCNGLSINEGAGDLQCATGQSCHIHLLKWINQGTADIYICADLAALVKENVKYQRDKARTFKCRHDKVQASPFCHEGAMVEGH